MKMMMLLLLACSAALMISSVDTAAGPIHHICKASANKRNEVLKCVGDMLVTLPQVVKESFVEDIQNLTRRPHKCKAEFFCKAEAILANHTTNHTDVEKVKPAVKALTRKLTELNADIKPKDTCDKVNEWEPTDDQMEFQKLLELLKICLEFRNGQKCRGPHS